jgi:hypothetical protein
MFLFEKYQVSERSDVRWNKRLFEQYSSRQINNMIIVGPPGCGKKSFVAILLRTIYGSSNDVIFNEEFSIKNYGNNTQSVTMPVSKYTMYFKPVGSALDKYIIQDILLNFLNTNDLKLTEDGVAFKTVVINGFDLLSYQSQASLRRILEEKSRICRFILVGDNIGTLIEPVRHRCHIVTIQPPTRLDLSSMLDSVIRDTRISITDEAKQRFITESVFCSKTMLWALEMYRIGIPYRILWHDEISRICDIILVDTIPSIKLTCVKRLRASIGKLFVSNIDINDVCEELFRQLYLRIMSTNAASPNGDYRKKLRIVSEINGHICEYMCRIQNSTRYMLHMEAMVYKILHTYVKTGLVKK